MIFHKKSFLRNDSPFTNSCSKVRQTIVKIRPHFERISKIFCVVDRHEKTDFLLYWLFWLGSFFWSITAKKMAKKDRSKKIQKSKKSFFFMPIDHTKKFLKSVHTKTLFLEPFSQIFEQLFVNGEAFLKKLF